MTAQLFAASDGLIGKLLLGRYRVVRELAKGGMGVVYLARAEGAVGFVKPVVIKLLLPEHAQDDRYVRMFVREAQILAQLRHPSLAGVLDFGEHEGAYVLVLEYVRGYHIGQWLRFLAIKQRDAPAEILVQIIVDVLDALHHAHNQMHSGGESMQIVHRDVSPSNILLDEDGRARLLDFGVARMRGIGQDYKTQVDGVVGKLPYTAPELFEGVDASPRSDLYACGVVLHEALLGRNVFRAEMQAATLQRVMSHVPEGVEEKRSDAPPGLDAVLAKALSKSASERPADAREFAGALRKLQREQESDVRARLATMLKDDFGREMADMFNLESLADRDEAWRLLSIAPSRTAPSARMSERPMGPASRYPDAAVPPVSGPPSVPPAMGATVANSPLSRSVARQVRSSRPPPAPEPQTAVERELVATVTETRTADSQPVPSPTQQSAALEQTPSAAKLLASQRMMLAGMVVLGCLAVTAMVLSLRRPPAVEPPAHVPAIRVVSEPIVHSTPELDPPPRAAAGGAEPHGRADVTELSERGARKDGRAKRGQPDARLLTQAFRKQQPKLEVCFKQHSGPTQAHPSAEIEFDLAETGKLTRVELAPRALATTALGQCLLQVARKTTFPGQGRPVTFAIPLSARGAAEAP